MDLKSRLDMALACPPAGFPSGNAHRDSPAQPRSAEEVPGSTSCLIDGQPDNLASLLEGSEIVNNAAGTFLLVRHYYSFGETYGAFRLAEALNGDPRWPSLLGRGFPASADCGRLLFLDTETTGLDSASATIAFMVGLAFKEGEGFCFEQLIARRFQEEPAMLFYLEKRLREASGIVSYNGLGFDCELLKGRYLMKHNRRGLKLLDKLPQLDLLYPSRTMWKRFLPDCCLQTVEKAVLLAPRSGDLPGSEIPRAYWDYIRSGEGRLIARAALHNEKDVLALMALLACIFACLDAPDAERAFLSEAGTASLLLMLWRRSLKDPLKYLNLPYYEATERLLSVIKPERDTPGISPLQMAQMLLRRNISRVSTRREAFGLWWNLAISYLGGDNLEHRLCMLEAWKYNRGCQRAAEQAAMYWEHNRGEYLKAWKICRYVLSEDWSRNHQQLLSASQRQKWEHRRDRLKRLLTKQEAWPGLS